MRQRIRFAISKAMLFNAFELKKTTIFLIVDIVMMLLFTSVWFTFSGTKSPIKSSIYFTAAMQTFFFIYYYAFDSLWDQYMIPIQH